MMLNEDELRKCFESWFEDDAMPLEANWFKRDKDPEFYENSLVEHSWCGYKSGWQAASEAMRKQSDSRYEKLRKLNPRQFAELYKKNLDGEGTFDELVDKL